VKTLTVALLLGLYPILVDAAFAGGFEVLGISARSAGMGGSLSMLTGSPTGAYFNPATLTHLEGTQFSIGTTVTLPNFRFTENFDTGESTKMQTQVLFPPNVCLTHTFRSGLGVGIAATIPFSSKTDWGIDWVGRNVIAGSEFRALVLTPMVSFRATAALSVGIGLNVTSFRYVRSARLIPAQTMEPSGLEGTERMQADGSPAYGVQLGVLVAPSEVFSLGIAYRSRSKISIEDGSVVYEWPASAMPPPEYSATSFSTSMVLPDKIRAGISFRPVAPLLLVGELELSRWSSFEKQVVTVGDPATRVIEEQQDWKDVLGAHAGIELLVGDVALRAGVMLKKSPVPDAQLRPSMPDADCTAYTAGIGYIIGEGLTLDVALQSLDYHDRAITNSAVQSARGLPMNGTYIMSATVVGLNVSYSWK
jgi:long-chain fatty acid transport protein